MSASDWDMRCQRAEWDLAEANADLRHHVELWQAALKRAEAAEKAIKEHNDACLDLCGRGEQEGVRCQYRPYLLNSGRRCTECPTYNMIDMPAVEPSGDL